MGIELWCSLQEDRKIGSHYIRTAILLLTFLNLTLIQIKQSMYGVKASSTTKMSRLHCINPVNYHWGWIWCIAESDIIYTTELMILKWSYIIIN